MRCAAAWRPGRPAPAPGSTSRTLAATPVGGSVCADARLVAVNGRELTFEVLAFDDSGKIGEGSHRRAIVDERRFLERVAKKTGQ